MTAEDRRRRWVRRLTPLLLLAAVLLVYRLIAPKLPHDRQVAYELGALAPKLVRLDVSFSDPETPDEGPALMTTWHFQPGQAPRRLTATVRLHDGAWDVDARLVLVPPSPPEEVSRRITLREGTTIIRLGAPPSD